jgi:hypothetical protein
MALLFWCALFGYMYFFYFFYNEPELGTRIDDPGMTLTPFPSTILDVTRFEPLPFNHESSLTTPLRGHSKNTC